MHIKYFSDLRDNLHDDQDNNVNFIFDTPLNHESGLVLSFGDVLVLRFHREIPLTSLIDELLTRQINHPGCLYDDLRACVCRKRHSMTTDLIHRKQYK